VKDDSLESDRLTARFDIALQGDIWQNIISVKCASSIWRRLMLRVTLASAALSVLMPLAQPAAAVDLLIDGVPLPSDA
jgi:hypothetical protein